MFVGIDVGQDRLHSVAMDERRRVTGVWLGSAAEIDALVTSISGATLVAVDAPDRLSTAPHRSDTSLSPKFRTGRCAEIALGRDYGIWVPWVSPSSMPLDGWIRVGLDVFARLDSAGVRAIEVYPQACYRLLAGARLPKKQSTAGVRTRLELLSAAGVSAPHLSMWSHDGLDALVAALTAHQAQTGRATAVTCGHDGSAIWVPEAPDRSRADR